MSRQLALFPRVQRLHQVTPQPLLCTVWWRNRAELPVLQPMQPSSERLRVSGELLALLEKAGAAGVWSRIACSSFSSLPPLFDFVLPALCRGSHREGDGK